MTDHSVEGYRALLPNGNVILYPFNQDGTIAKSITQEWIIRENPRMFGSFGGYDAVYVENYLTKSYDLQG